MKLELVNSSDQASGRRMTRIKADAKLVFLHAHSTEREECELIDESFGGIGVLFQSKVPFRSGQELEVSYNGVEMCAVVRHITVGDEGTRVGFEWKAAGVSRELREAVARHNGQDDYLQFLVALPSGFYMMWKLFESEKWFELNETADRLLRLAIFDHQNIIRFNLQHREILKCQNIWMLISLICPFRSYAADTAATFTSGGRKSPLNTTTCIPKLRCRCFKKKTRCCVV